jgi:hypothetical protein
MAASNNLNKVKIDAKAHFYHNNGSGRDTYISHINGGILSQDMLH